MKPEEVGPAIDAARNDGNIFLIVLKSTTKQEVSIRATHGSIWTNKTLVAMFNTEVIAYIPLSKIDRII